MIRSHPWIRPSFWYITVHDPDCSMAFTFSFFQLDDTNATGTEFALFNLLDNEVYSEFCLDVAEVDDRFIGTMAQVCVPSNDFICQQRPCVSYCCPRGDYYDVGARVCSPFHDGTPPALTFISRETEEEVEVPTSDIKLFFNNVPKCKMHSYSKFKIFQDGHLDVGVGKDSNFSEYCIERYGRFNPNTSEVDIHQIKALVCVPEDPTKEGHYKWLHTIDFIVVPTLFVISLVFLALLFVYVYVKNRQKLFGVMTLCLILMLVLFYVFLIVAKFWGETLIKSYPSLCLIMGLALQYLYLSAMFWLNSLSFDIWSTFRKMRRLPEQNAKQGWRHKKFKWYALYSWSSPLVVIIVTIIMQFLPDEALGPGVIRPDIGKRRYSASKAGVTPTTVISFLCLGVFSIANGHRLCI